VRELVSTDLASTETIARLAGIGGGTGNYSQALQQEGWAPIVVDRSSAMLARAAAKGLQVIEADAQRLPIVDASFDAVAMVSMLHHVDDRDAALGEARRILRPGGKLVLLVFTAEDAASLWVLDYFPVSRAWMKATHPPRAGLLKRRAPAGAGTATVLRWTKP
jgi:ubiquinone/menaquinone biosynthesis C-methylase UbiE